MARGERIRVAECIYRDASGYDTIVKYKGRRAYERWPLTADLDAMKLAVQRARVELMDRHADQPAMRARPPKSKASLEDDVARYLPQRKGRPGYATDATNLKAWIARLGPKARRKITTEEVNLAIAAWRTEGKSDQTIIHRLRVLRDLYRTLDGRDAPCPVTGADRPKTPHPHPVAPPRRVLQKVAAKLPTVAAPKHVARFLVLATCAQRPAQVERARPEDVDLKRKVWMVRSAKGEPSHPVHLNKEQVAAWRAFIAANCWGQKARKQYYQALRKAGYPKDISSYNVRHAAAQDALDRGADLSDIQGLLGHTEIETTRRMYAPLQNARQKRVAKLMESRLVTPKK